jgi:hypothetical protein
LFIKTQISKTLKFLTVSFQVGVDGRPGILGNLIKNKWFKNKNRDFSRLKK